MYVHLHTCIWRPEVNSGDIHFAFWRQDLFIVLELTH